MSSQDPLRESLAHKLTKRRLVFRKPPRVASMELPERLKDGDDDEEDVLKPKADGAARFLNQSVMEMISRAGRDIDFQARIDESSSESESEAEPERTQKPHQPSSSSTSLPAEPSQQQDSKHARASSRSKLFRSVGKLRMKSNRESQTTSATENMMTSQILTPRPAEESTPEPTPDPINADAPVLSRKLLAEALYEDSEEEAVSATKQHPALVASPRKEPLTLERKLMELFGFDELETIIAEYKCWLLQSVLLDGYLYVTQRHICFYSYLPKKATTVAKSGFFNKRGLRNPRYRRYYFELKGDVLTYYESPSNIYYPRGKIDLRYGISANVTEHKDRTYFSVVTEQRTYNFRADSAPSAKQWVKSLQKAIFRSHNDGDMVKISIPIDNVIDFEENQIIDFAETVKLRVFDNDETYAIEEYYFSFLNRAQEALRVMQVMVDGNQAHHEAEDRAESETGSDRPEERRSRSSLALDRPSGGAMAAALRGTVQSTLSPVQPASRAISSSRLSSDSRRSSHEITRRSFDQPRRSSTSPRRSLSVRPRDDRSRSPLSARPQESISSPTDSHEVDTESSAAIQSLDGNNISASQILDHSDVFRRPTLYDSRRSISETSLNELRRASEDTARSSRIPRREHSVAGQGRASLVKESADIKTPPADIRQTAVAAEAAQGMLPSSFTSIQDFVRAGTYPLQRASNLAGFLRERSKRMSNLVATESMGYYEKVAEMWAGGGRHYNTVEGLAPDDGIRDPEDDEDVTSAAQRFRDHFALPETEQLIASFYTYFHRVIPLYGKIYISNKHFCYRTLLPGVRTKLLIPLKDIEGVNKEKGYRPGYCALVIVIRGHEEIFFDFRNKGFRDDCAVTLILGIEAHKNGKKEAGDMFSDDEDEAAEAAKAEHDALLEARKEKDGAFHHHEYLLQHTMSDSEPEGASLKFDDLKASILNFKPPEPMRITCLTIGSRGDVQPYIALCKRLLEDGHKPKIATHAEFEPWIRSYGIDFAPVAGDPAELMRICVEYDMFTPTFMREVNRHFRGWLDDLLNSAWEACQDAGVLIESPSAMAGIHIAEALEIPYFRAFTMPWTRTRSYPHAFAVPNHKMGGTYNYTTYVVIENLFWGATANQINRWRKKMLGLKKTDFAQMQQNKVPFLYNFSPHFVIPPLDYSDWIRITGYWFLDEGKEYTPSSDLANFIKQAREDGKKLVYVGFGSIVVDDPTALTQTVIEAVRKADVRCILSKGWSDRLAKVAEATKPEVPLPSDIFQIKAVPHDWLFTQIDAAVHHGGAGTTGASLRAGIPTLIKPFFGDQHFTAMRVEDLGVGIVLKKLNKSIFAKALWEATHSERMIARAADLGRLIRSEDGVGTAIKALYRDMEYARSLIKHRNRVASEELDEGFEETWTFIGDESDSELGIHRRAHEWDPKQLHGGVRVAA